MHYNNIVVKFNLHSIKIMTKQKLGYESPTTNLLVVWVQGVLMGSDRYYLGGGGSYDDNDTNENGDF